MNEREQYLIDRTKADAFLPVQIDIVKKVFRSDDVAVAGFDDDTKKVKDLLVDGIFGVSLRVREHNYLAKYRGEFTIRLPHELDKILTGEGDWMLYGFKTQDGKAFADWSVYCLHAIRRGREAYRAYVRDESDREVDSDVTGTTIHPNNAGQNSLRSFKVEPLRPWLVMSDTTDPAKVDPHTNLWTPHGRLLAPAAKPLTSLTDIQQRLKGQLV